MEETLNLLSHAKEAQDITDRIDTWQTTGDWEALAQAVRSLKTNLVSLKDLRQYSEFEEHLQTMKRRFEQLIRPQLYESLSNRDSIALAKIWKCCEETDQKDIFIDVWVSERSACIQKMWSNCWRQTFQAYSKQPHEITENISDKGIQLISFVFSSSQLLHSFPRYTHSRVVRYTQVFLRTSTDGYFPTDGYYFSYNVATSRQLDNCKYYDGIFFFGPSFGRLI